MTYNHASARHCCECGAEYHFRLNLKSTAAEDELIAGNIAASQEILEEWFDVETVTYSKHVPWNGKKNPVAGRVLPSFRVTYNCRGIRAFTEYVNIEHPGHAGAMARRWWSEASGGKDAPLTVDAALAARFELQDPARIRVWVNRKNPQVQYREFQTS
jgi:hypothetical protein